MTKTEAAVCIAIIAAEIHEALGAPDDDYPSWADDLDAIADALHPLGGAHAAKDAEKVAEVTRDRCGRYVYDARISYAEFERILLSLGASGSDVGRFWPLPVAASPVPEEQPQ